MLHVAYCIIQHNQQEKMTELYAIKTRTAQEINNHQQDFIRTAQEINTELRMALLDPYLKSICQFELFQNFFFFDMHYKQTMKNSTPCTTGKKIYNPRTNRCVSPTSQLGKFIVYCLNEMDMKKAKVGNNKTLKNIKSKKNPKEAEDKRKAKEAKDKKKAKEAEDKKISKDAENKRRAKESENNKKASEYKDKKKDEKFQEQQDVPWLGDVKLAYETSVNDNKRENSEIHITPQDADRINEARRKAYWARKKKDENFQRIIAEFGKVTKPAYRTDNIGINYPWELIVRDFESKSSKEHLKLSSEKEFEDLVKNDIKSIVNRELANPIVHKRMSRAEIILKMALKYAWQKYTVKDAAKPSWLTPDKLIILMASILPIELDSEHYLKGHLSVEKINKSANSLKTLARVLQYFKPSFASKFASCEDLLNEYLFQRMYLITLIEIKPELTKMDLKWALDTFLQEHFLSQLTHVIKLWRHITNGAGHLMSESLMKKYFIG